MSFQHTKHAVCSDSFTKIIRTAVKDEPRTKQFEDVIGSGRTSGLKSIKKEMTHSIPNVAFNGQRPVNVWEPDK
jgi:hypothetical protein